MGIPDITAGAVEPIHLRYSVSFHTPPHRAVTLGDQSNRSRASSLNCLRRALSPIALGCWHDLQLKTLSAEMSGWPAVSGGSQWPLLTFCWCCRWVAVECGFMPFHGSGVGLPSEQLGSNQGAHGEDPFIPRTSHQPSACTPSPELGITDITPDVPGRGWRRLRRFGPSRQEAAYRAARQ
jgi:hypothetical protein